MFATLLVAATVTATGAKWLGYEQHRWIDE